MRLLVLLLGLLVLSPFFEEFFKLRVLEGLFFTAVGQLYLVILVSWLVGMHVSMKSRGDSNFK